MKNTCVRVWGLAMDGKIFNQNANLRTLSRTGAQIEGVLREIQCREIIGLQYDTKRARVLVSSVDSRQQGNVILGVELLTGERCPWEEVLDIPRAEIADSNRRRYQRHPVELPVELGNGNSDVAVRVLATDVCGNGCYLQTMATAPVGTLFLAKFWALNTRITCECTVRTSDLGLGMGVEFTGLDPDMRTRLQRWLEDQGRALSKGAEA